MRYQDALDALLNVPVLRAKRTDCVGGYDKYGRKSSDSIPSTVGTPGAVQIDMHTAMDRRYEVAMAAGRDAAEARMRNAGRTKWGRADYNAAVAEFNRINPLPKGAK